MGDFEKQVVVYRLNQERPGFADLVDMLDGDEVLPGLQLPVKMLFE